MIKGCQKEMIVLQTKENPMFESAYFILRRERPMGGCAADMLAEANRLIGAGSGYLQKRRRFGKVWPFLLGIFFGAAICALLFLLFGR
ncbi:MAG: hypothetical protein E7585_06930 [Ruminococcaceae bacterium]|nr:hypothetical protein [Oscillospiraceae bacterium]